MFYKHLAVDTADNVKRKRNITTQRKFFLQYATQFSFQTIQKEKNDNS